MFSTKPPKERLALLGIAMLVAAGGTYAVVRGRTAAEPIRFESLQSPGHPSRPSEEQRQIQVHIAGAIKHPGVYRLSQEARVTDGLAAAGGATTDADLVDVNLAAKLVDGTQLYVPRSGHPDQLADVADPYRGGQLTPHSGLASSGGQKQPPAQPLDLNSASAAQLQSLPGVGPSTAEKIVDYRAKHHRFRSVEELTAIPGIGEKKLEAIRKYLRT